MKTMKSSTGQLFDRPVGDPPRSSARWTGASMRNQTDFGPRTALGRLIAMIGWVVLIGQGAVHGQIDGAVQYPPVSIGEDAQPPAPAKMVPQPVSPRQVEFGVRGSCLPPLKPPYRTQPNADRLPRQPAPLDGASPVPPPTRGGSN